MLLLPAGLGLVYVADAAGALADAYQAASCSLCFCTAACRRAVPCAGHRQAAAGEGRQGHCAAAGAGAVVPAHPTHHPPGHEAPGERCNLPETTEAVFTSSPMHASLSVT
jgi:hypothetical protein